VDAHDTHVLVFVVERSQRTLHVVVLDPATHVSEHADVKLESSWRMMDHTSGPPIVRLAFAFEPRTSNDDLQTTIFLTCRLSLFPAHANREKLSLCSRSPNFG
jgi:hypothetical protein